MNHSPLAGLRSFLYRRLARWITCEVHLAGGHPLALNSKYQVNSLQDVFCHPFYWQLFGWLHAAPELIVDLGAHCGHFSMLADTCFRAQFGAPDPEYVLIEPNPDLVGVIEANLRRSGLCRRHSVANGLVGGVRSGSAKLWVCPHNYLSAGLKRTADTRAVEVEFLDLDRLLGNRLIDLLKIDIEGAEFEFVKAYPGLLGRVRTLMIEIHENSENQLRSLHRSLENCGLRLRTAPIEQGTASLAMFEQANNPSCRAPQETGVYEPMERCR